MQLAAPLQWAATSKAKRILKVSANKSDRRAQVRTLSASPKQAIDRDQW
jgi:hypothetical protein